MLIFGSIAIAFFILMVGGFLFGHDHDGADHSIDHGDISTVSIFSVKVIATFGMGFGAAGALASYYKQDQVISSLIGIGFGFLLAGAMYLFLNLMARQQSSSLVETSSLIGQTGTVTVAISENGSGEVAVSSAGNYATYSARASNEKSIPKGKSIRVVRTSGSLLLVEEA